jgi:hypothetical protein
MTLASFIKVLMLTAFLSDGSIVHQSNEDSTLIECSQAKEEATRFNNRFLWPWEKYLYEDKRIYVACFWHPETKEA